MSEDNSKLSIDQKLDAIFISVEKTRKYFLMILWFSVLVVVLPMIGMALVLPKFLESFMALSDVL